VSAPATMERGLVVNVERLRRRGEIEHADKLNAAWRAAQGAELVP